MEYPSVPTDNLYKFIALAGLALAMFSVTYPTSKMLELGFSAIDLKAQAHKNEIELESLKHDISLVERKEPEERSEAEVRVLRKTLTELNIKHIDIQIGADKAQLSLYWLYVYLASALLGLVVGLVAAKKGFTFWYVRVQEPQDRKAFNANEP